jgi:hypothetical protein
VPRCAASEGLLHAALLPAVVNQSIRHILKLLTARTRAIQLALLACIVLGGLIYSVHLGSTLRYLDEGEYYTLANNIVGKHQYTLDGVHPSAFRPPGYPLFLSLFISFGAGIAHLRFLNFLILAGCVYLVSHMLEEQFSLFASLTGTALIICYPVFLYAAGTLYPQTLGSLLFLTILQLLSKREKTSTKDALLGGLVFGALILTVSIFVFSLFVVVLWIVFSKRKAGVMVALKVLLAALLIVAIWSGRNLAVFHSFVFVSSNVGVNLFLGNSENTTPNAGSGVDLSKYTSKTDKMSEIERDAYYRDEAIEFVLQNKSEALELYFLKVLNYFKYRNELVTKSEASSTKDALMFLTYGPLLVLFFVRMLMFRRFAITDVERLFIAVYLSNAFFQALFFTRIRFRVPFDFLMIFVVAVFISSFVSGAKSNNLNGAANALQV